MASLVSLGWAATQSATSPSTTPSELDSLRAITNDIHPLQNVKPYVYLDNSTRGYASGLTWEADIDIFPGDWNFKITAGLAKYHKFNLWVQNEPKFLKATDLSWVDLVGSGWVRVTLMATATLEKGGALNHVKFKIQTAINTVLT